MSVSGTDDALRQVHQFWSMLDDLSENDPAAYRKFIEKQMTKGAQLSAPPELHSCVRTRIQEPKPGLLYINICSWKRVPAPPNLSSSLPMSVGKLETATKEGQGWSAVLDVAVNPAVLQECNEDKADINNVYKLALHFLQQQLGMQLSQEYSVVSCSPNSSPDDFRRRLGFQMQLSTTKQKETDSLTPASLLWHVSSQQSEKQDFTPPMICSPVENKKKDLIQVLSSTSVEPQKPEYQLEVRDDTAGVPRSMNLTVELPKVYSMSECQLSVSKDDVLLEVADMYYLLLDLPKTVKEDTASAIFNRKKQRLTLTLDVL